MAVTNTAAEPGATPTAPATDHTMTTPAAPAGEGQPPQPADPAGGTTGGQQPGSGDQGGEGKPAPTVPERYELKVPEGAEEFMDQADLDAFAAKARERGLTQEQAVEALEAQADAVAELRLNLRKRTEADPVYGGKNLEANQQAAQRLIDRVRPQGHPMTEAFNSFLRRTGAGNALELFAFFADAGKLMAEDQGVAGGTPPVAPRSPEEVLYKS